MTTLSELIESTDWPSPMAAQAFLNECEIGWGTEGGREEIMRWIEVLGKPSQFLGHKLWTVEDLKEHFEKLGEYEKALEAEAVVDEAPKAGRPTSSGRLTPEVKEEIARKELAVRDAAAAWHGAIDQRRAAVAASKAHVAAEIKKLRDAHDAYVANWDKYVEGMREALRLVRGY